MMENDEKFSWKWYLILVTITEIITTILTIKIGIETRDTNDLSGLGVLLVWIPNVLVIFVSSIYQIIEYKKYKAEGCNTFSKIANVVISLISVVLICIGVYCLNLAIFELIDLGFDFEMFLFVMSVPLPYLSIGIGLIFPVIKSKK